MSLPPVTVQVKRKATDDPVEFLRIHESGGSGKRQRQDSEYVFSRRPAEQSTASQPVSPGPRKTKQLQQLPHFSSSPALKSPVVAPSFQAPPAQDVVQPSAKPSNPSNPLSQLPEPVTQPRRYHIYRDNKSSKSLAAATARGRKPKAAVFVERRIQPKSANGTPGAAIPTQEAALTEQKDNAPVSDQSAIEENCHGVATRQIDQPVSQKRPGKKARTSTVPFQLTATPKPSPAPLRNVVMPSGLTMPWDVTSDRLVAEMQAYTLQEIGKNLAEAEAARPKPVSRGPRTPSKFKPKKPAKRYSERHPESIVDTAMDVDEEYVDVDMDDDAEYIIDTYVRVPAEAMESGKSIGLLILESQPDIEDFYGGEDDSSEEEDDGDEDENAENHYTADYPDEEVDSDDEYGRNAYNYRTHNASDLEEYDEDDAMFSDDENEATKYPWMKKQQPWLKKAATHDHHDDDDDDDDE
ncbi:hypothetical protein MBM_04472 [Drepanopeziza brunnea f. sp. 'multigermtubi' MB_m1]|uniref:Transcription factor Iwr1 domain-containing protein n=1 Tax=Marssonina brunnea f. sp. multigermtubi (strain MB_m1) TaxID=1072389 RepID=K1WX14_MARBU|nr:uncharacterized protein MBM_04472 [Drepanopeziza brunnea f. sp. 'multigermtubi' MB_m1]EKD17611.1 hypothetical protein MBM_04472 [Drepanopeziza brunnea f. sp. 'multigermtubi' MB_m1]